MAQPIILWFLLRILTSIIAAFTSSIKPINPLEINISLLPPSAPFLHWLERAFLSPWLRWDAEWYQRIVTHGYSAVDGTAQFHPLYPLLAVPLVKIGILPVLSLLIISGIASMVLFYFFRKLARLDLEPKDSDFALMLFAFTPPAFILFAPYPEALFLLLSVLCLFFARRKAWWKAGLMGCLATLTRQQGIFLLIPLVWEFWETIDHKSSMIIKHWRSLLGILLVPMGYVIWLSYRAFFLYDIKVEWSNFHRFIYSFLISSSSSKVVEDQQFIWPWQTIGQMVLKLSSQPDADIWINTIIASLLIIFLALAWKKMRISYKLYSLVIVWISLSYYTGPVHPVMGLPRHLFLAFPVSIGLAGLIQKPWQKIIAIVFFALFTCFLVVAYVLHAWTP